MDEKMFKVVVVNRFHAIPVDSHLFATYDWAVSHTVDSVVHCTVVLQQLT